LPAGPWWSEPLLAAAIAGDVEALATLRIALPSEMPSVVRRRMRDQRLHGLARAAFAAFPGETPYGVACFLERAGGRLEQGRALGVPPFTALDAALPAFERSANEMLTWLPPNLRTGNRWPTVRTIYAVIITAN
jgi:hypothetical protein